MARVLRACCWTMPAALWILTWGCTSRPSDPNALPAWIGSYPGSSPHATGSAYVFETKDDAEKVLNFYEQQLDRSGVHKEARGGGEYGGFLSAADDSHSRNVMIDVRAAQGTSEVTITPVQKK